MRSGVPRPVIRSAPCDGICRSEGDGGSRREGGEGDGQETEGGFEGEHDEIFFGRFFFGREWVEDGMGRGGGRLYEGRVGNREVGGGGEGVRLGGV